MVVAEFFS